MSQNTTIFNFSKDTNKNSWMVVNDDVMGGISSSAIVINTNGNGIFSGSVSLENNGGFASVRHVVKGANLNAHSKFIIKVKGDGKSTNLDVNHAQMRDTATFSTLKPMVTGRKLKFHFLKCIRVLEAII